MLIFALIQSSLVESPMNATFHVSGDHETTQHIILRQPLEEM
jgi:hypothetical protein